MGLDMFAYSTKKKINESVDFSVDGVEYERIAYWRKHPDLHGWMEKLYRSKGGAEDSFNMVNVRLDEQDIDALEEVVLNRTLPETTGFFFGRSGVDDQEDDIEFIAKARECLAEGKTVFYTSWW